MDFKRFLDNNWLRCARSNLAILSVFPEEKWIYYRGSMTKPKAENTIEIRFKVPRIQNNSLSEYTFCMTVEMFWYVILMGNFMLYKRFHMHYTPILLHFWDRIKKLKGVHFHTYLQFPPSNLIALRGFFF